MTAIRNLYPNDNSGLKILNHCLNYQIHFYIDSNQIIMRKVKENTQVHNKLSLRSQRKLLRNNPTAEEAILWKYLKNKQTGFKFRRQHSIGPYILDFYCPQKRLAIELDGSHHFTPEGKESDKMRDDYLKMMNINVLRFPNHRITKDIEQVLNEIRFKLESS